MKFLAVVAKTLSALGLVVAASAAPQLTGAAVGDWTQVDVRTVAVVADALSDQSETRYDLAMVLRGEGEGRVRGEMRQRLPDNGAAVHQLVYALEGQHRTLPDGRVLVQATIVLDLALYGGEGVMRVGALEGLLYPIPGSLGYCPGPIPFGPTRIDPLLKRRPKLGVTAVEAVNPVEPTLKFPPTGEFVARWVLF